MLVRIKIRFLMLSGKISSILPAKKWISETALYRVFLS